MDNTPLYLPAGSTIGVMAPSSYVQKQDIVESAKRLEDTGYKLFIHPQTYEREGQSAGTTLQKALAFQGLYMRADIDAIWLAGGGNHAVELIGAINFQTLAKRRAKPIIGFSDGTILINALAHHTGAQTWHAPVFKQLASLTDKPWNNLISHLQGTEKTIPFTPDQIIQNPHHDQAPITAPIKGGNLSLAQYLPSLLAPDYFKDSILLLEDCHEEISRIDRMLAVLKQSGALNGVKAVLLGQFSDLTDTGRPFERSFDDIIQTHLGDLPCPILYNLAIGHNGLNTPTPINTPITINLKNHFLSWA